jgi:hypothetical protein
MPIPELWGIDPDIQYVWTPNDGREIVTPVKRDEAGKLVSQAVYGEPVAGAPAVLVAPITGQLLLSLIHI